MQSCRDMGGGGDAGVMLERLSMVPYVLVKFNLYFMLTTVILNTRGLTVISLRVHNNLDYLFYN